MILSQLSAFLCDIFQQRELKVQWVVSYDPILISRPSRGFFVLSTVCNIIRPWVQCSFNRSATYISQRNIIGQEIAEIVFFASSLRFLYVLLKSSDFCNETVRLNEISIENEKIKLQLNWVMILYIEIVLLQLVWHAARNTQDMKNAAAHTSIFQEKKSHTFTSNHTASQQLSQPHPNQFI